ncbi:intermediate conductance calcium-activated potassium channel protein 4-like [Heptranchias perlo]|uniref:intermediate conductance calcium-activated potassium channel protein 4-like n=1 Tax=Heptranchias perlo TaxID=212740 RepID=UPI00355965D9
MSCRGASTVEQLPTWDVRGAPARTTTPTRASAAAERRRKRAERGRPPGDIAWKLQRRKCLLEGKRRLSAWSLLLAGLGIGLMIVTMELSWHKCHMYVSSTLGAAITISTLLLLGLIVAYHIRDIQLFMIDEGIEEWTVALTRERKLYISLELLVCVVHPYSIVFPWTSNAPWSNAGIVLSNLMFLRIYLVQRVIFLYSKVLNPSYQTIGSLSKINLKFYFVLKVLMNRCPGKILLLFVFSVWFIASWALSLCERQNRHNSTNDVLASMWLIPITFLTIGYGDKVPFTACGKFICLIIGALGVFCTALFIAVIAKKLELSKDEKHVHNFMQDILLTKEVQKIAANLIEVAWLLYKHRKRQDQRKIKIYQRSLLSTVCKFRKAKLKQRKLWDQVSAMMELSKMHFVLCEMNSKMSDSYSELEKRLVTLATKVDALATGFEELPSHICEAFKQQLKE